MSVKLTNENFEEVVLNSKVPVLVDFYAEWCPPCKVLSPVIDQIAKDYEGTAIVGKVNVDNAQNLAAKYGVRGIPSVMTFWNGEVVDTNVGVSSKLQLESSINSVLG